MSIATMNRHRQEALAVMHKAYRTYGTRSFIVDRNGPNWTPLKIAERLGWVWFQGERCAFLPDGMRELEPYRKTEPKPAVVWICPVCLDTVEQAEGDTGLPEPPHCPSCSQLTRERIEELLTEQQAAATRRTA
jgi:hypothetical protein